VRDGLNPALAACLYAMILVATAFLLTRRAGGGAAQRATATGLCIVAMLLPMARVVGTNDAAELIMLVATVAVAGAALIHLTRSAVRAEESGPSAAGPMRRPVRARGLQAPLDPERRLGYLRGGTSSPADANDPVHGPVHGPAHSTDDHEGPPANTPSGQATRALHEVDDLVSDYAHRLGLDTEQETERSRHQRRGPGTERGSNP
jgi:hypothetical protein